MFVTRDDEGFHFHKLEYIEPDQVGKAVQCMRRIRKLQAKLSHSVSVCATEAVGVTKRAKTLPAMPIDASLPDDAVKLVPQSIVDAPSASHHMLARSTACVF